MTPGAAAFDVLHRVQRDAHFARDLRGSFALKNTALDLSDRCSIDPRRPSAQAPLAPGVVGVFLRRAEKEMLDRVAGGIVAR